MASARSDLPDSGPQGQAEQPDGLNEKSQPDSSDQANGKPDEAEKAEQDDQQQKGESDDQSKSKGPAGGFSDTPIPKPPPGTIGYTLKITMHRATDLAMGDAHVLSSDPYVMAQLNTDLPTRHKEDPKLRFRTPTIRRTTDAEWNAEWIVANVPSSGFKLKLRVYDEDPADHDDLLGKVHVTVPSLDDNWSGIKNEPYRLLIRDSSKRAQIVRAFATCFHIVKHFRGELFLSIEMLGRTGDDGQNGRTYTVGPCRWIRHYDPLLGRIAHIKEPGQQNDGQQTSNADGQQHKQVERYNFQANQIQLPGPVPPELYHRFVEFKPWVARMFTTKGLQGMVLGKALHHQYSHVYNFDKSTIWGSFEGPCTEMTKQFLELVRYDKGGRIFTYVLTLDAFWRFTETGPEFGIDMLSKHTMHSDVSIYIAFSGEFFIRRLKHRHRPPPPHPVEETSQQHPPSHSKNEQHPPDDITDGPPDEDPPTDPRYYELVIDNDSGTYRPNAQKLPVLSAYLAKCLPGLHIQTLDCQADEEKMNKMKSEQRDRKKKEGDNIVYTQADDSSSISSSEDGRLEAQQAQMNQADVSRGDGSKREHGAVQAVARDVKRQQQGRMAKAKRTYGWRDKDGNVVNSVGERVGGSTDGAGGPSEGVAPGSTS